jgi:hypothetical protein
MNLVEKQLRDRSFHSLGWTLMCYFELQSISLRYVLHPPLCYIMSIKREETVCLERIDREILLG